MVRRRDQDRLPLDLTALQANAETVVAELAADFDWRLPDARRLARQVAARAAGLLADDPPAAANLDGLRRLLEREACAEYFALLYDGLQAGGGRRTAALADLLRPEEVETPEGVRPVYRGYLYRAAVFYLMRWTGRKGWAPPPDMVEELAHTAAEDVLMALLRSVELREGRRAFWAYLSRAVERRTIDQLRLLSRRGSSVSLEALAEARGGESGAGLPAADGDTLDQAAAVGEIERMMEAARLSPEERFSLYAGAYGLDDTESAAKLGRQLGRAVGPPDIRRWRFRGREKLRRAAEREC